MHNKIKSSCNNRRLLLSRHNSFTFHSDTRRRDKVLFSVSCISITMIIPKNCKSFLKCMILTFALQPLAAVGSSMMKKNIDASGNTWVHRALLLDPNEFIQVCKQVFLRQEHLQKNSYLMSDYATEVSDLCQVFAPNPEQGTCRMNDFNSIGPSFQTTFFQHASNHMDIEKLPINVLMSMGDAGYIVSDKSMVELNSMRNDLCVELHLSFGGTLRRIH